ncbi:TGS domain-containing protein [Candidatus Parcubacteria bacterium]|nr:TGS domain-containing protein [Candidatus Parcubacteria bacterium]
MLKKITQTLKKKVQNPEALELALKILKQNTKEGSFTLEHNLRVALIVQRMGLKEDVILAALSNNLPLDKLFEAKNNPVFKEVFFILKNFQKLKGIFDLKMALEKKPLKKWQKIALDLQAENIRKMFFVLSQDLRPVFLMLGIALDEMRNLQHFNKETRAKKSLEALEIFSPLAYSLGALKIKGELEDFAFPQLYFKEYQWLLENMQEKTAELEKMAKKMEPIIEEQLKKEGVKFIKIESRGKHYFSLYQKLLRYNLDLDRIYDLVALRIITGTVEDCYKALGAVHRAFRPLEGRIKDYIAKPKQNGYRALQTTVFCPACKRYIEIQIKTEEMHKVAEYGLASHLVYKQQGENSKIQYHWMNQLRQWQEETKNPQDMQMFLKNDIFKNKVFVFTPKKEIIELPQGSTPIDLAYAIHSDIGEHCVGAKVNGKMVSLNKHLETGQTVEILTSKAKSPSSDWLRIAKTPKAQGKIKEFFEKVKGISFRKERGDVPTDEKKEEKGLSQTIKEKLSFLGKIMPKKKKEDAVLIGKQKGIAYKIAKCCQPSPKDAISAFLTLSQPASIHKQTCQNFLKLQEKSPERIMEAEWL